MDEFIYTITIILIKWLKYNDCLHLPSFNAISEFMKDEKQRSSTYFNHFINLVVLIVNKPRWGGLVGCG